VADFDFYEFKELAADFDGAAAVLQKNSATAVKVTCLKTKQTWRDKLKGSATLPGLPYAVDFDVDELVGRIEAEVGFNKGRRQGALGNVSEFGTPTVGPRGFGLASLEENLDDFVTGQEKARDDALKKLGG
jgi:hypothetical protein